MRVAPVANLVFRIIVSVVSAPESSPNQSTLAPAEEKGRGQRVFVTTHWSLVLAASRQDTTFAREALSRLCETYWYPLYAYVRRRGYTAHDAQDLTQEFFARLLERNWLAQADRERGRFERSC